MHVTLYCTRRPSDLATGLHGQGFICTLLQTDNHATDLTTQFLQARWPSCHPTNSIKPLKANSYAITSWHKYTHMHIDAVVILTATVKTAYQLMRLPACIKSTGFEQIKVSHVQHVCSLCMCTQYNANLVRYSTGDIMNLQRAN